MDDAQREDGWREAHKTKVGGLKLRLGVESRARERGRVPLRCAKSLDPLYAGRPPLYGPVPLLAADSARPADRPVAACGEAALFPFIAAHGTPTACIEFLLPASPSPSPSPSRPSPRLSNRALRSINFNSPNSYMLEDRWHGKLSLDQDTSSRKRSRFFSPPDEGFLLRSVQSSRPVVAGTNRKGYRERKKTTSRQAHPNYRRGREGKRQPS
ncbi:hypothetical protein VTN02DRAFT_1091 [Thermoascus thermophilus]